MHACYHRYVTAQRLKQKLKKFNSASTRLRPRLKVVFSALIHTIMIQYRDEYREYLRAYEPTSL